MRGLIVCFFLLISGNVLAQIAENKVDPQGRKQGFWKKKDADGKLIYQATFKDDKPVGEMKRFHLNGKIKAILNFEEGSDISDAQLFDERGKLIAKGKYSGQKKTGEWNYLKDNKIVSIETFRDGQKNGIGKRFYQTGELLEESNWLNDGLHGIYRTYFQNGKPYLECNYSEGRRNGVFVIWFPSEVQELNGFYANNIQDKEWNYFDENGKLMYTLKYAGGELLNPEVKDSLEQANAGIYKNKGDDIPDPEKFMQNPEEYMELMKNR